MIVAIATAGVGLALRDPTQAQLDREAERLVALLESARAEARAAGLVVSWQPTAKSADQHFSFQGLPAKLALPSQWLGQPPAVEIEGGANALVLGPEPLLHKQSLRLRLGEAQLRIGSDGLQAFAVLAEDAQPTR